MPTIQEVIETPAIRQADGYDIASLMVCVESEACTVTSLEWFDPYEGGRITADIVVDVTYDHRRGAQASVVRFDGKPFAVVTRAGRELDDIENTFVFDRELAAQALLEIQPPPEFETTHDLDEEIDLAFWEGTPVELGDQGRKEVYL